MKPLLIPEKDNSPAIRFDPDTNHLSLSGDSTPENCMEFYKPVIQWLENYRALLYYRNRNTQRRQTMKLEIRLNYFNTTSAKFLLEILKISKSIGSDGHEVELIWFYENDDQDMKDAGMEMAELANVNLVFVMLDRCAPAVI
jgi:hypothetical protein